MNFLAQQQEVANRLRLDLTQASNVTLIQGWLNMAGQKIWAEADWNFALQRQVVQTVADYSTGTVSINSGATTATGVSTVWTSSMVGYFIQFSRSNDWYKITAVGSTTSLTIEAAYTPTTNLSAGTYTIRNLFYVLGSTVEKILDARQAISPVFIDAVYYRDFDIYRPNATATGNPYIMVVYGQNSSGQIQFTLYPFPSAIENIEVRYKQTYTNLVNNTDTSTIPTKWNETTMIDGAEAIGLNYISDGSESMERKAAGRMQLFLSELQKMVNQQDFDTSYHPVIENRDKRLTTFGPMLPFKFGYPQ